jgi:outer membrane receptor protein involved in Fe transport
MSKSTFKGSLLATTMIAGVVLASPAFAQNQPAPAPAPADSNAPAAGANAQTPPAASVQTPPAATPAPSTGNEIVITGTLIRNPNLVASAPVTVVGHDEMQLRQTNTAEEVLRTIPGAAPSIGAQVNNGNGGSSYVNLRSLGSNRNIVLLDGVRIVPVDLSGRVDLNTIPLALIDRVDVLTGGASSTYGADAVAGVINFITRSDFAGMELAVSDQITQRGDGNYLRGDLTLGANFDDGRGNAVLSMGYQESDPVYQGGDRPWSDLALDSTNPGSLAGAGSSTTTPSAFDIGGGRPRQQVSSDGTGITNFYQPFNFNPYNVFQVPFKRYNLFTSAHYDISDHLTVYGRGMYNNTTIDTIIAPSGVFGSAVTVNVNNPYLSAAQRNYFCANADFNPAVAGNQTLTPAQCAAASVASLKPGDANYQQFTIGLRRRTPEVGPRISDYNTQMFDFRAGVRGDITDKIGFDVFAARGESSKFQAIQNYVLLSRTQQALLANNTSSCFNTANSCVPIDIFGQTGTITPAMVGFVSQQASNKVDTQLSQLRGVINGDTPLQLWAKNPVSFAVGGEYRKYHAKQASDALAKTAGELGGAGGAAPDINGGFDVYEGYAEMIAPIVSDMPFAEELQLEAGIRRSHYTINASPTQLAAQGLASQPKFNTTTWKVAGDWAPIHDIKFRGNYQHAVRAPNIAELFTPLTTGLTNLSQDPCALGRPVGNPGLTAVCLAQGAQAANLPSIANPTAGQANITTGGNLSLKPEKANTWTVGAVLRPRFLQGFSATVDYYHIKVTDAITVPTPGDLITACFGAGPPWNPPASQATSPACTAIRRNPISSQLDGSPADTPGLFGALSNGGKITTDGIDFTFDYRHTLGTLLGAPSKIALNFGGNWTNSQKFQATPTSVNRECVGYYSANCGFPAGGLLPEWSFNERTTLSLGRVDLSLLWRYMSSMRYEPGLPPLFSGTIVSTPSNSVFFNDPGNLNGQTVDFNHISAASYFDWSTRFNVNEHFDLTFTIMNLFDKKPPIVGNTAGTTSQNSGNTFPSTYDPLGRRFAAGARIKF